VTPPIQNRLISLMMVDTTTDRDVVVGDVLVEQSLAIKLPDTRKDESGDELYKLETPFVLVSGRGGSNAERNPLQLTTVI